MAIYRFRVSFEDYEDIYRELDMPSKSSFLDLHEQIHQSLGYDLERSSSFYVSNDQWKKGIEIAYLPNAKKQANKVLLVADIRLSKFIDDPHQKFYYIYNFDKPYEFHVELIKILKEEEGKEYPALYKKMGEAPKNITAANFPLMDEMEDDEEDEIPEEGTEEYGVDEEDEFDMFDDESSSESDSEKGNSADY